MFRKPFLASEPAFIQLIVFAGVFGVTMLIALFIGYAAVSMGFGVNFALNPDSINNYSDPNNVRALKVLQLITSLSMFVLAPIAFSRLVSRSPLQFLGIKAATSPYQLLVTFLLMALALPMINAMAELNRGMVLPDALQWLEAMMQTAEEKAADLTEAFLKMETVGDLLFNLFMVAVIPAVGEELVFRGVIQRLTSKLTRNVHAGIWISAILFSAIHGQFYGFFPRMFLGAIFGYLFVWSGSLWLPILAHFTNNGLAVVLSFAIQNQAVDPTVEQVGAGESDWVIAVVSLVLTGLGLWVIHRRRQPEFAALHAGPTHDPKDTKPPPQTLEEEP